MADRTTSVVIGAGHAGLAMSRFLADRSVDHVVLERAEVANSWRTQRWDSLRLLTPNWMTRLPGYAYRGADPDGYLSAQEVAAMLEDYVIDRTGSEAVAHGQPAMARTDDHGGRIRHGCPLLAGPAQETSTVTLVGLVRMS